MLNWLCVLGAAAAVSADFGLITTDDLYIIDTGASLNFTLRRVEPPGMTTISVGGIESLWYKGVEYTETTMRDSHIGSGFDWIYSDTTAVDIVAKTVGDDIIIATVTVKYMTHYYIVKKNEPRIYMGTYWTKQPDIQSQIRFLFRLNPSLFTTVPKEGDVRNNTGAVESADIFYAPNGDTVSKHYTNHRLLDWENIGAYSDNVGMFVVRGSEEYNSGGPFYRSLLAQTTSAAFELTYIINYAQAQTEAFRKDLLAMYVFVVTDGEQPPAPTEIDYSFYKDLDLIGFVGKESRGKVTGTSITNRKAGIRYTVGLNNEQAQYWGVAESVDGSWEVVDMLPGTYKLTVFKNELEVRIIEGVVVTAGRTTTMKNINIQNDPSDSKAIFRIGDWDGSPEELRNGKVATKMHPSDQRLASWDTSPFVVGTNNDSHFPCYMWKGINHFYEVQVKLTPEQRATTRIARMGVTISYASGRPALIANAYTTKESPAIPQPTTRSLTTGSYRGNNQLYEFEIPPSAWFAGDEVQTLIIKVEGNGNSGYLNNAISIDAFDLLDVQPASTAAPATAEPSTFAPTAAPATKAPATRAPATAAPATSIPATPAPQTPSPATSNPVTTSPSTDSAGAMSAGVVQVLLCATAVLALIVA
ncbi:putative rhamnogalacturonate lyase A [Diplonema papillatum]|nr:putative rhamnogalacturonate lyase A [Diplonema papillatum]